MLHDVWSSGWLNDRSGFDDWRRLNGRCDRRWLNGWGGLRSRWLAFLSRFDRCLRCRFFHDKRGAFGNFCCLNGLSVAFIGSRNRFFKRLLHDGLVLRLNDPRLLGHRRGDNFRVGRFYSSFFNNGFGSGWLCYLRLHVNRLLLHGSFSVNGGSRSDSLPLCFSVSRQLLLNDAGV